MNFHQENSHVTNIQIKKWNIPDLQESPCALLQSLPSPSRATASLTFNTMDLFPYFDSLRKWNHTVYIHYT